MTGHTSKTARHDRRWTDDDLKKLMALWLEEKELDEIADHFGSTRYAIQKQVYRMRQEGIPLPRRTKGHRAGRRNKPWTQEEVEYLVRRRNDKATAETIALELDRSFLGIQGMIQNLRKENVDVRMLGQGKRRLWNPDRLRTAMIGRGLRVVGADGD